MDAEVVKSDIQLAEQEVEEAVDECRNAGSRELIDPLHVIGFKDDGCNSVRGLYR